MKYRLTEDWLEYKKGQEFFKHREDLWLKISTDIDRFIANEVELSLLLKTGILEEVKEEEWAYVTDKPWEKELQDAFDREFVTTDPYGLFTKQSPVKEQPYDGLVDFMFKAHSLGEQLMLEKIKTLLLSLKK